MPAQFIWTFPSATQLRLPAIPNVPAAPAMTSPPLVPAAPAVRATPGQLSPPAASATPGLPSPTAAPAPQPEQGRDACPNCRNRNPPHADGSVMGCGCCAGTCEICWIASAASAVVRGCWFQSLPHGRGKPVCKEYDAPYPDGKYLHTIAPLTFFGPTYPACVYASCFLRPALALQHLGGDACPRPYTGFCLQVANGLNVDTEECICICICVCICICICICV